MEVMRRISSGIVFLAILILILIGGCFCVFKYKIELFLLFYQYRTIDPITIDGVEFPREEARNGGAEKIEWWYIPLYLLDVSDPLNKFNAMIVFHRDAPGPQIFIVDIKNQKKYFTTIEKNTKIFSSKKLFIKNASNFIIETDLFKYWLRCHDNNLAVDLRLTSLKNPIFLRQNEKGKNIDIIQSRISASGSFYLEGKKYKVEGLGLIYHQSPPQVIAERVLGWKWLAIQLDNNKELVVSDGFFGGEKESIGSLYLFNEDSSGLNFRRLKKEEFALKELDSLASEEFNRIYPVAWNISVPSESIDLKVESILKNQIVEIEKNSTYEGVCKVSGAYGDKAVGGWAYSEQVVLPVIEK